MTPPPLPDAATAEQIFARVRSTLAARAYACEISYAVTVEGYDGKAWRSRTYDSIAFPGTGDIRARSISREESANPYTPPDDLHQLLQPFHEKTGPAGVLASPRLSPTYGFGLVPQPHVRPASAATPGAGDLPTIGTVSALARIYDVTLAGSETVNGAPAWHLKLRPLGNPGAYRVRDVWVDRATSELVRLTTDGNFTAPETGSGLWTVSYGRASDGGWYVTDEISSQAVTYEDATYWQVQVHFTGVAPDARPGSDLSFSIAPERTLEEP